MQRLLRKFQIESNEVTPKNLHLNMAVCMRLHFLNEKVESVLFYFCFFFNPQVVNFGWHSIPRFSSATIPLSAVYSCLAYTTTLYATKQASE